MEIAEILITDEYGWMAGMISFIPRWDPFRFPGSEFLICMDNPLGYNIDHQEGEWR